MFQDKKVVIVKLRLYMRLPGLRNTLKNYDSNMNRVFLAYHVKHAFFCDVYDEDLFYVCFAIILFPVNTIMLSFYTFSYFVQ